MTQLQIFRDLHLVYYQASEKSLPVGDSSHPPLTRMISMRMDTQILKAFQGPTLEGHLKGIYTLKITDIG